MKSLKFILAILLIVPTTLLAQVDTDALVSGIKNDQLLISCYNTQASLDTYSKDVIALIKLGKPVTKKITPLLTDPEKAIIAHYILIRIWKEKGFGPVNYTNDSNGVRIINFHGLVFRQSRSGHFSTTQSEADINKANWLAFLPRRYR